MRSPHRDMMAGYSRSEGHAWWTARARGKALPMGTRSVVVAGRRPPMVRRLKRVLEREFEVAGMADNILSMLDVVKETDPALLVIGVGSAEFGACYLARRLRQRHPDLYINLVGDGVADAPGVPD